MGTAKSGYIQRKMVKSNEDIQVRYDGTVRDASGKIYQFAYGENGYDPLKTVPVDSTPQVCDISRLTGRLNTCYENKLPFDTEEKDDPEISYECVSDTRKKKMKNTDIDSDDDEELIIEGDESQGSDSEEDEENNEEDEEEKEEVDDEDLSEDAVSDFSEEECEEYQD
jgi:hypothetical protein